MSTSKKSQHSDRSDETSFDMSQDSELERKVDAMMSLDPADTAPLDSKIQKEVAAPVDEPIPAILPEPLPAPVAPVEEKAGAPVLPINKTAAFKKKIAVLESSKPEEAIDVKQVAPSAPLPADNELEPFEEPTPREEPTISQAEEPEVLEATSDSIQPAVSSFAQNRDRDQADDLGLDSPSTARAVDEIVAAEADELMQSRDQALDQERSSAIARSVAAKQKEKSKTWKRRFIKIFAVCLLVAASAAAAIPGSRYAILNTAGVRVSSSMTILDETTGQPLKNAEFSVDEINAKTDSEGKASVSGVKLGKHTIKAKKPAYSEYSEQFILGWGSNPLGEVRLKAVGSQYTFIVKDFLSGKSIARVEVTSGEANARSDDNGKIVLAIPQTDSETVDVQFKVEGYRDEVVKVKLSETKERTLVMAPSRKHAFISKRAGTFDLYKIDVDGKNEKKVLSGTGQERSETLALAMHPTKNIVALVSTREKAKSGNDAPNTLTLVNLDTDQVISVAQSQRLQLINWIGDKFVYVKIGDNEAENSKTRHRLVSYDSTSKNDRELASSNYFNDIITIGSSIYYAPAAYEVNGSVGLYKVNADGNVRKTIIDKEVWNIVRINYDKLSVFLGQDWFDLATSNDVMTKSQAPSIQKSRNYIDAPDGKTSLWTEERDGKGTLLTFGHDTKDDKVLQAQSGLKDPIYWLDQTHIVFRVSSTSEIADYVMSADGGPAKKIRDVTDTAGIDRWYYY